MTGVVDLHERLSLFSEHWSPKVVARINDYAKTGVDEQFGKGEDMHFAAGEGGWSAAA